MLHDVYRLRFEGTKLPKSHLIGMRGRFLISPGQVAGVHGEPSRRVATARVHVEWPQPFPGHAAASLYDVQIRRYDERGMLLVGREVVLDGLGAKTYPQSWACVPVPDLQRAAAALPPGVPAEFMRWLVERANLSALLDLAELAD